MTNQEYTMRRDLLRDAIRQQEAELEGLYVELRKLEEEEQENKDK